MCIIINIFPPVRDHRRDNQQLVIVDEYAYPRLTDTGGNGDVIWVIGVVMTYGGSCIYIDR